MNFSKVGQVSLQLAAMDVQCCTRRLITGKSICATVWDDKEHIRRAWYEQSGCAFTRAADHSESYGDGGKHGCSSGNGGGHSKAPGGKRAEPRPPTLFI